jgi:hypothetical protein
MARAAIEKIHPPAAQAALGQTSFGKVQANFEQICLGKGNLLAYA